MEFTAEDVIEEAEENVRRQLALNTLAKDEKIEVNYLAKFSDIRNTYIFIDRVLIIKV